jgi:hypothetical protein
MQEIRAIPFGGSGALAGSPYPFSGVQVALIVFALAEALNGCKDAVSNHR